MTQRGQKTRGGYGARQNARKRRQRTKIAVIVAAVAVAAIVILMISRRVSDARAARELEREVNAHQDTFQEGVSINGVELTGYSRDEAQALLDSRYEESLNAETVLTFGDKEWRFTPRDMGAAIDTAEQVDAAWQYGRQGDMLERQAEIRELRENPVDLNVTLTYDRGALEALAQSIKADIDLAPVSATMQIVEVEKFEYTDSFVGYNLDADALVNQLEGMIRNGESGTVTLEPEVIQPDVSREELEASTLLLGECYTTLKDSSNSRISNVNLALSYFNFKAIDAGKTVSFNRVVGKRTKENGFKEAPEYAGTTIQTGYGGGTCQASTTLYGALIRAGLQILERYPHTMTVGYVPGSQDAAVSDDKDLRFKNTTESKIYIFAYVDMRRECAVCKIYGKPIDPSLSIDIESNVLQSDIGGGSIAYMDDVEGKRVWYMDDPPVLYKAGKPGLRSEAYRVYYDALTGEEVRREKLSSDYYSPESDTYLRGVHER